MPANVAHCVRKQRNARVQVDVLAAGPSVRTIFPHREYIASLQLCRASRDYGWLFKRTTTMDEVRDRESQGPDYEDEKGEMSV